MLVEDFCFAPGRRGVSSQAGRDVASVATQFATKNEKGSKIKYVVLVRPTFAR